MIKQRFIILITLIITLPVLLMAQQPMTTADGALELFNSGKYSEAKMAYQQLLTHNNKHYAYNYYYGISLYYLKENNSEAIQRLKLAAIKPPSNDVYFYLGQLYQRAYENQLAISQYEIFLKKTGSNDPRTEIAQRAINDCQTANTLINKHFEIKVLKKDTVDRTQLLNYYALSKDAGQLMKAADFFKIGVGEESIIFKTERGNQVFFPLQGKEKTYDLYKIVKLLDSWTDADLLQGSVNSPYNDLYPFMLIDGTTLYFASDRPGGMGGLDIYQSFWDPESGTFSEPANLGPPFNSPDDDFLLVPDEFEGKAWFATNRGVTSDKVIVVEIVWDNNVIRSFTQDVNQIKTLSDLPLSADANTKSSTTLYAANQSTQKSATRKPSFQFQINDTLVYNNYDQFLNPEALALFKKGQAEESKKDSLQNLMSQKRKLYAQSYDQKELQKLIDEIVILEKQTYGQEDMIKSYYFTARTKELSFIRQKITEGNYHPSTTQTSTPKQTTTKPEAQILLQSLNKSDLTFYTDEAFIQRRQKVEPVYKRFFNPAQVNELLCTDSLYVWANILSLEAARTLEETHTSAPQSTASLKDKLLNSSELEEQENQRIKMLIEKSRSYKMSSLDLYEQALNQKFAIYYPVVEEYGSTSQNPGNQDVLNKTRTIFKEAHTNLRDIQGYNPEKTERLLALKRMSVDMLESSLLHQMQGIKTPAETADAPTTSTRFMDQQNGKVQPSYQTIQRDNNRLSAPVTAPSTAQKQEAKPVYQKEMPVYKIQIGVFQNEPNAAAIAKIPAVSSRELPGRNLRKYYTGSWHSYEEASDHVQSVREAGFPGAFVVAFLNNEPISLEEARKMK